MKFAVRREERREALAVIQKLASAKSHALIVHYSCESFKASGKQAPRITSIAVRKLSSGATHSFSIHEIAELKKYDSGQTTARYDEIEKEMLKRFFGFIDGHKGCEWIHWNMRDTKYGFAAIEHRYRALGGKPAEIDEDRKHDLARLLVSIYGRRYATHPRLENVIRMNRITDQDFLTGKEEALAFERGDHYHLHKSTLRKVDVLGGIFDRVREGTLETDAKWYHTYGVSFRSMMHVIKQHPVYTLLCVAGTVGGVWQLFMKS